MDLLRVVATPHNTVIDAQMWSPNYDAEPLIQHKFVKKLNYQTEEDLHHQLLAVTFLGNMAIEYHQLRQLLTHIFKERINMRGTSHSC